MKKIIIIAEAGVNHNGDVELAKRLIDEAASANADYVKFQTFVTELTVSKTAKKAEYQIQNTNNSKETQYEMVKKLEFSFSVFEDLQAYCKTKGIGFLSTGFDIPSVQFLASLDLPYFKIPSGEITNKPYLQVVAQQGKPIILSTGMSNISEIKEAIAIIVAEGLSKKHITVLHCNTEYPTPMQDVNLLAMNNIRQELGVEVGYSDHTLGIEIPVAAVVLGATIIEKHFTLDKTFEGPDHSASLDPEELRAMVKAIRNVEMALSGSGLKEATASEIKNKEIVRKSLHYKAKFKAGHVIAAEDLLAIRPGNGINPMNIDTIIGKVVSIDVEAFDQVKQDDLR